MAKFSLLQFLHEQRTALPLPKAAGDVSSKTFMVTGSNVGLGFEASVHLAKMKPKLLLATSRDSVKCEQAHTSILQRVAADSVVSPEVSAWPLDLCTFETVRAFVDKFAAEGDGQLNVLVANAGVFSMDYVQTQDGWETIFQVNYLATALLSILLLPYLVNSSSTDSPSRLVIVSSGGQYLGSSNLKYAGTWDNVLKTINDEKFGSGTTRYNLSKLLVVIFVRELVARLPDPTPVVVCTVDPGYCASNLFRDPESKWYMRAILSVVRRMFFARSVEEGSRTLVHAAVAGEERSMHGRYLSSCQVTEENDYLFTPEGKAFASKVWAETIATLSEVDSRVSGIVSQYLRAEL
ncbi:short-chain dehydrogenase [Melanogaster broomeanus]|nr:short-chain dehydrogenase [Melanogaster broomeanus]